MASAQQLGNIFIGITTAEHRKYLRALFEYLLQIGYTKIHSPCAGAFVVAQVAIEAGFEKKNIYTSDINLYSNILGYLYSGQPIEEIGYEVINPEFYDWYKAQPDDVNRAAVLMFIIKIHQLSPDVAYTNTVRRDMLERKDWYKDHLAEKLRSQIALYGGINYKIEDLRKYYIGEKPYTQADEIVYVDMPTFGKYSTNMFRFGESIKYTMDCQEIEWNREWVDAFHASLKLPSFFVFLAHKKIEGIVPPECIIYADEKGPDKFEYLTCTQPEVLDKFDEKYVVKFKSAAADAISHYKLYPPDRELTVDDKISIRSINGQTALYYRDLFAHRLGATVSEAYYGVFVEGMLLSVCAFNSSFLARMQDTFLFESFCFSTSHNKYENINRVSEMCITSGQFKKFILNTLMKLQPYVELKTMRTVCISKYRKAKAYNNLLTLKSSERMEGRDMYKLTYEQEFYMDRDYKKCLEIYLSQDVRLKGAYTQKNGLELQLLKLDNDDTISNSGGSKQSRATRPSERSPKTRVDSKRRGGDSQQLQDSNVLPSDDKKANKSETKTSRKKLK